MTGISDEYLKTIPNSCSNFNKMETRPILLNDKSNEKFAQEIKEAYYATTTFVDAQIGRILKKLKKTGLDKNTIVVFTSDHGYHLVNTVIGKNKLYLMILQECL